MVGLRPPHTTQCINTLQNQHTNYVSLKLTRLSSGGPIFSFEVTNIQFPSIMHLFTFIIWPLTRHVSAADGHPQVFHYGKPATLHLVLSNLCAFESKQLTEIACKHCNAWWCLNTRSYLEFVQRHTNVRTCRSNCCRNMATMCLLVYFPYFENMKLGLCDHYAVCESLSLTLTFDLLNQSLWNVVCTS
jgi:hypothetical protein